MLIVSHLSDLRRPHTAFVMFDAFVANLVPTAGSKLPKENIYVYHKPPSPPTIDGDPKCRWNDKASFGAFRTFESSVESKGRLNSDLSVFAVVVY